MKASELRSMTREELEHEVSELREEEFRLRLRRPTEELPNALRLRSIRRDIARIQTLLREDKLGLIQLPKKTQSQTKQAEPKTEKKASAAKPAAAKKPSAKPKASSKKTSSAAKSKTTQATQAPEEKTK
jgi:large subunit ribosomal protein L29